MVGYEQGEDRPFIARTPRSPADTAFGRAPTGGFINGETETIKTQATGKLTRAAFPVACVFIVSVSPMFSFVFFSCAAAPERRSEKESATMAGHNFHQCFIFAANPDCHFGGRVLFAPDNS